MRTLEQTALMKSGTVKKPLVIDLVDSDDDERKPPASKRGKVDVDLTTEAPAVVASISPTTSSSSIEAPIKLFATLSDESLRQKNAKSHWSSTQCQTLREMLQIGNKAIQWIVITNYIVNFEYLLAQIPELVSIPNVVLFYGAPETDPMAWNQFSNIELICLRPSDPPGPSNPLPRRIPYGVHHSKIFLVGYADETCRVIIHTANLRPADLRSKAQAAYLQDFSLKKNGGKDDSCDFQDSLVTYLATYNYRKTRRWLSGQDESLLTAMLRRYNFSTARAILLPSVPGYHRLDGSSQSWGHWKLRQTVAQHTTPDPSTSTRPIVCQFSSIGSLTEKYLRELQISMDTNLCRIRDRPIDSKLPLHLQLVYPTVAEIRNSVEGYRGGASVPGTVKNTTKAFLRPLFRKWSSTPSNTLPLKGDHVPHIKTYYQASGDNQSMDWLVVSSHNLSKAAWGEIQVTQYGRKLFIRHWELGVFVSPSLLGVDRLVHWTPERVEASVATVPMPYKLYFPDPYRSHDQPWAVDGEYTEPDRFGLR